MKRPAPRAARQTLPRLVVHSFLNGLLVLAPVAVTLWILYQLFVVIDGLLPLPGTVAPGIGFALVVAIVTAVGLLTSNFLATQFLALAERLLSHVPFVRLVYTSIKELTEAFVGQNKRFDRPVLLALGELEAEVIGFVTRDDLSDLGLRDRVAVYVPQSYNFAANLLIVPARRVRAIDRPPGEVMAFVVSGGLTSTSE